jgi:hypothetical protein
MDITDAQRKRLQDYAPSSIYMHADGSAVALLWERASVEIHRITPTGEVWTSKRAFDEDEEWEHDVMHQPQNVGIVPIDPALLNGAGDCPLCNAWDDDLAARDGVCECCYQERKDNTKPCDHCGVPIDSDIHTEELGMCLDCSNKYWGHEGEDE